jgi:hypothetical protein
MSCGRRCELGGAHNASPAVSHRSSQWSDLGVKEILDSVRWLLEKDIRVKNATTLLLSLIATVIVCFISYRRSWFQDIRGLGAPGVGVFLLISFLILYLSIWLVWSGCAAIYELATARRRKENAAKVSEMLIRQSLSSLTAWQRQFLLRFIVEDRNQIPEFEIGQYRAAWDFEVEVLVTKGIVHYHRAGVYEIVAEYRNYLKQHWDPSTGSLH